MMMLAKVEMVRKMDNRAFKPPVFNAQRIWAVPALHTVSVRQIQYYTQTCVCDANTMWYTNILTARRIWTVGVIHIQERECVIQIQSPLENFNTHLLFWEIEYIFLWVCFVNLFLPIYLNLAQLTYLLQTYRERGEHRMGSYEYWLVSAPGDKTCQQTFDKLNQVIVRRMKHHTLINNLF